MEDRTPGIHRWLACFDDPEIERQYRDHGVADQRRRGMAMVAVVAAVPAVQVFGELPRFLAGEHHLGEVLLARLIAFVVSAAMFAFLRRTWRRETVERVITLYVVFVSGISCVIYGYYPAASTMAPAAVITTVGMIYFFTPLPLPRVALLGLVMSVAGGVEIVVLRGMSSEDTGRLFLWLLSINLMGYFGVRAYSQTVRALFWDQRLLAAAYRREQEAFGQFRQFAELISHEFRNPLAVVKSKAQLLSLITEKGAPTDPDALPAIERAVNRLDRLFRQWLARDRLAERDIVPVVRTLPLSAVFERVRAVAPQSSRHPIRFEPDGGDTMVRVDLVLLEIVLSNLIDNAIKYSPEGGAIGVAARRDGEAVVIVVEDHGIGIAPDHIERVFEKYFRVSHDGAIRGFGLGLFLVRQIIRSHGGSVTLTSTLGRGTSVLVRLPAADGA